MSISLSLLPLQFAVQLRDCVSYSHYCSHYSSCSCIFYSTMDCFFSSFLPYFDTSFFTLCLGFVCIALGLSTLFVKASTGHFRLGFILFSSETMSKRPVSSLKELRGISGRARATISQALTIDENKESRSKSKSLTFRSHGCINLFLVE